MKSHISLQICINFILEVKHGFSGPHPVVRTETHSLATLQVLIQSLGQA